MPDYLHNEVVKVTIILVYMQTIQNENIWFRRGLNERPLVSQPGALKQKDSERKS